MTKFSVACSATSKPLALGVGTGQGFEAFDRTEAIATVREAVDAGVDLLDTEPLFGDRESESIVGEAFRSGYPDSVMVATKCILGATPPEMVGSVLERSLTASLRRLRRSHGDFLVVHGTVVPDGWTGASRHSTIHSAATPLSTMTDAVAPAMSALVSRGLIRGWGFVATGQDDVDLEVLGSLRPDIAQIVTNAVDSCGSMRITDQEPDHRHRLGHAVAAGTGILGIRAHAAGSLTDALDRSLASGSPEDRDFARAAALRLAAAERGTSVADLALRVALHLVGNGTVVVGARNRAELAQALGCLGLEPLDAELLRLVDAVRATPSRRVRLPSDETLLALGPEQRAFTKTIENASTHLARPGTVPIEKLRSIRARTIKPSGNATDVGIHGPTGTLSVRLHRSPAAEAIYVHVHGGGFVFGSAIEFDPFLEILCTRTKIEIASVDYRLAPEHPFPAGRDDVVVAVRWALALAKQRNLRGVVLGAESAGANLALSAVQKIGAAEAVKDGLLGLALSFGFFDVSLSASARGWGSRFNGLSTPWLEYFADQYGPHTSDEQRRQSDRSPVFGNLCSLPPTLVMVGDDDPLLDDSRLFAMRAKECGVDVCFKEFPGAPHAFIGHPTGMGRVGLNLLVDWVNETTRIPVDGNMPPPPA